MPSDVASAGAVLSVRIPCGTHRCAFSQRRRRLGGLTDLCDAFAWPILTTFASLAPHRLSRLIRNDGNPNTEADPVG